MQKPLKASEFLLLSRGKWDPNKSPEEIQRAIDDFYVWHEKLVGEGKFKVGERLSTQGKVVSVTGVIDGPFTETKEVIGGYWFVCADSLEEAAAIVSESPCLPYGLYYEIRPLELQRASAWRTSSESPQRAS